uniref:Serpentine receptor class gamma n=2 Tax=Panagrellus redivivus TaxID=6233 RepID=A0A7E4V7B0_PANRE
MTDILSVGALDCHVITTDLLLLMLINLYDQSSKSLRLQPKYVIKLLYIFIAISNVVFVLTASILFTYAKMPWGLNVFFKFVDYIYMPVGGIFQLSRIILLVTIITLNNRFGRKLAELSTPRVVEFHRMLAYAINTNVLFTCIFTRLPMVFVFIANTICNVHFISFTNTLATCLQQTVMVGEMLIMLYYVKPYKRFIMGLFKREIAPVMVVSYVSSKSNKD